MELAADDETLSLDIISEQLRKFLMDMKPKSIKENPSKTRQYWEGTGKQMYPELYKLIKPFTELIPTSAEAERTWAVFKSVHTKQRNRLSDEKNGIQEKYRM